MSINPPPDSNKKLTDHQILIFDVYGTLCDWETGLYTALQPLLKAYPSTTLTWTRKDALTAFSSVEGVLQAQLPGMAYRELLERVYVVLEARLKAQEEKSGNSSSTVPDPVPSLNQEQHEGPSSAPTPKRLNESPEKIFARSIPHWPIFQDSSAALARLAKHFKLVVLSNVDNESLGWTHKLLSLGSAQETDPGLYSYPVPNPNKFWHPQETSGSQSPFTAILTAQDVGCYKPSLKGFRAALDYFQSQPELFGITAESPQDKAKEKVLSVAQSLRHDIEPANELGLRSVWIDRQSAVTCNEAGEGKPGWGKWTWRFETLGEMAEAVEREVGQCR